MAAPKRTLEDWLCRARAVHGDLYDYSLIQTVDSFKEKVLIKCKAHGVFSQTIVAHARGQGCPKCATEDRAQKQRMTFREFQKRAFLLYGDSYSYSENLYESFSKKITVICAEHGEFTVTPKYHLVAGGCPECPKVAPVKSSRKLGFVEKAIARHGDRYDYRLVQYVNSKTPVEIICPVHGAFLQQPGDHLSTGGCKKCGVEERSDKLRLSNEDFIKRGVEVHGDKYCYDLVDYKRNSDKVMIICPRHGEFQQTSMAHVAGEGCPNCVITISNGHRDLISFIKSLYRRSIYSNYRTALKSGKELDIYLPDLRLAIEFNGLYWHSYKRIPKSYHYDKTKECRSSGIKLIHVWEDDWLHKNALVKALIERELVPAISKGFYLDVIEISKDEATRFTDRFHLRGYEESNIHLGSISQSGEIHSTLNILHTNGKTPIITRYVTRGLSSESLDPLLEYSKILLQSSKILVITDLSSNEDLLFRKYETSRSKAQITLREGLPGKEVYNAGLVTLSLNLSPK